MKITEYIKKSDIDALMMNLIEKSKNDMFEAGKLAGIMLAINNLRIYFLEENESDEI